jgi:hypothetical protein
MYDAILFDFPRHPPTLIRNRAKNMKDMDGAMLHSMQP